ncbi:MAG: RNA 2',3'-cyclic phosphodiesterase [Candidatus Micrarchaeota archaeon]
MRCFLALELPPEIRERLAQAGREAKRLGVRASFVPTEQIHVTLAFFGEINEADALQKKEVLECECAGAAPFRVRVKGIGFLPDARRPRVLYAAVDSPALVDLQKKLANALNYDEGRTFHGHATIARLKQGNKPDVLRLLALKFGDASFGEFEARELALKKSVLTPDGAVHSDYGRIVFATASTTASST